MSFKAISGLIAAAVFCWPLIADDVPQDDGFDPSKGGGAKKAAEAEEDAGPKIPPEEKKAMDAEGDYIEALIGANMPDLAGPVIAAAKQKFKFLGPRLEVLEQQGALRLGKFDQVQKIIDSKKKGSPEYWALTLAMADAYYARKNMAKTEELYRAFFKAVPKPTAALQSFYEESAYRWIQMLLAQKKTAEAVTVFDGLLKVPMEDVKWCVFASEDCELLLKLATAEKDANKREAILKKATKVADKMLWKQDLIIFFGRAVSFKSHIEMLRGKVDRAQALVSEYMPQLSSIHEQLVEMDPDGKKGTLRQSPMPQCRYLLAEMLWKTVQDEIKEKKPDENKIKDALFGAKDKGAKRNGLGAYNHAINVFVKYPESTWAVKAGELTEKIKRFVTERYKKDIKDNVTADQMRKVRAMQFRNADEAYNEGRYDDAVKDYLNILAQFPEVEESLRAVGNLAESYFELWKAAAKDSPEKAQHRLDCDTVEGYLGERFSGLKPDWVRPAGDRLLQFAAREHDMGSVAQSQKLYDLYFANFSKHYQAAQMGIALAGQAFKAEDWPKAIRYYETVIRNYPKSSYYITAVQMNAICYGKLNDIDNQLVWLRKYAQIAEKPMDRIASKLLLANIQQKRGFETFKVVDADTSVTNAPELKKAAAINIVKAIGDFRGVVKECDAALASKTVSPQDKEKIAKNREIAQYLQGECWQRLSYPIGKMTVEDFRKKAVAAFEEYLKTNPKGKYGPVALVKIGTIHTANKDMASSKAAFARLAKDFPDSDEAKNSVPRLAKTLIDMGLVREGVEQYEAMMQTAGNYTAGQFLQAGEALLEAKGWEPAQQAFNKALELSKDKTNAVYIVSHAQLGIAKSLYGEKRYAEAHEAIDAFIEKNAKSAMVKDAYRMLITVASSEGLKEKDNDARRRYFNQAVDAIKKLRSYAKGDTAKEDELNLESCDVMVMKMNAEEGMALKDEADKTLRLAVAGYQAFLMSHRPDDEHPFAKMTTSQQTNLERAFATALPLMAKLGGELADTVIKYGEQYLDLYPNGKGRSAVQAAMNAAKAEGGSSKPAADAADKPAEAKPAADAPAAKESDKKEADKAEAPKEEKK